MRSSRTSPARPAARASARSCATRCRSATSARCEYDLLFERFLDENRREAPDIDIDFCKDRRGRRHPVRQGQVRRSERRPDRHVRHAGGPGRDPRRRPHARHADLPRRPDRGDGARHSSTSRSTKRSSRASDLRQAYDSNGEIRELIDLARKIEGLARNVGTHAAAVVIAEQPVERIRAAAAREGQDGSHHAMGDGRRRAGRPLEDGLPRPAEPHDPRQEHRAGRSSRAASGSTRTSSRSTTRRRSPCSAAARRRASSSSKAAAFAICCSG